MACDETDDVCLYIDEVSYTSIKVHTWEGEGAGIHNQNITLYASDGTTLVDTKTTPASGYTYVTFTGLTPNTTYEVVWDNFPATREALTTLPDNPRVATESQWADLASRIKSAKIMDYSLSEVDTGAKWIDGKHIYKKSFASGYLPSQGGAESGKLIPLNISNLGTVIKMEGYYTDGSITFDLQSSALGGTNAFIRTSVYNGNINIIVGQDRSTLSGYITLYYTKSL